MTLIDLLTVGVLLVVGVRLIEAARSTMTARRRTWTVVRGLEWRHFKDGFPIIVAVVATAFVLIQIPILSFGWWTAIGGVGNPVIGTTERSFGIFEVLVPAFFGGLLLVGLPLLVAREEYVFRRGAEHRRTLDNVGRSLLFGLAHAIVGIPIGAGLALSIGGVYLTNCYLRGWRETRTQAGALVESTRAHLAYNLTIVALVLVTLGVSLAFGWE